MSITEHRNCTEGEQHILATTGRCPYCGSDRWSQGPTGGASTNIQCANPECEARFNIMPRPFTNELIRPPIGGVPDKLWRVPVAAKVKRLRRRFTREALRGFWDRHPMVCGLICGLPLSVVIILAHL
jgi:hypothetical protein